MASVYWRVQADGEFRQTQSSITDRLPQLKEPQKIKLKKVKFADKNNYMNKFIQYIIHIII